MSVISDSVGKRGTNRTPDVRAVQCLLNLTSNMTQSGLREKHWTNGLLDPAIVGGLLALGLHLGELGFLPPEAAFGADAVEEFGGGLDVGVGGVPVGGQVAAEGGGENGLAGLVEQRRDGVQCLLRPPTLGQVTLVHQVLQNARTRVLLEQHMVRQLSAPSAARVIVGLST